MGLLPMLHQEQTREADFSTCPDAFSLSEAHHLCSNGPKDLQRGSSHGRDLQHCNQTSHKTPSSDKLINILECSPLAVITIPLADVCRGSHLRMRTQALVADPVLVGESRMRASCGISQRDIGLKGFQKLVPTGRFEHLNYSSHTEEPRAVWGRRGKDPNLDAKCSKSSEMEREEGNGQQLLSSLLSPIPSWHILIPWV